MVRRRHSLANLGLPIADSNHDVFVRAAGLEAKVYERSRHVLAAPVVFQKESQDVRTSCSIDDVALNNLADDKSTRSYSSKLLVFVLPIQLG